MSRLQLFKSNYEAQLLTNVNAGSIEAYRMDNFPVDPAQTLPMAFEVEDNISEKMYGDIEHEFEDAVTLYEALKNIPEAMAADPTFWISLAHTEFFPYVKKRWISKEITQKDILNHWFFSNGMMRHALGGLWWMVRLTVVENDPDPYKLTRVAFWNYSFRTTFMGPSIFLRIPSARTGVLKFLADHEELKVGMENRGRYIARFLNRLGATTQLAALPWETIYKMLDDNIEEMNAYRPRFREENAEE